MVRLPGWLVFLLFVPLQVYVFLQLVDAWGFWWSLLAYLVLGFLGTRAARAPFFRALLFPGFEERWEGRRHLYQGILFLGAALTWFFAWGPQPWLALAALLSLVKSAVR